MRRKGKEICGGNETRTLTKGPEEKSTDKGGGRLVQRERLMTEVGTMRSRKLKKVVGPFVQHSDSNTSITCQFAQICG